MAAGVPPPISVGEVLEKVDAPTVWMLSSVEIAGARPCILIEAATVRALAEFVAAALAVREAGILARQWEAAADAHAADTRADDAGISVAALGDAAFVEAERADRGLIAASRAFDAALARFAP